MAAPQQEIAMTQPKYRVETKGRLADYIADCQASMAGEIAGSGNFIFTWEDCEESVREWGDFLTEREMATCFKRATTGRRVHLEDSIRNA
jgi:hypothetical protein